MSGLFAGMVSSIEAMLNGLDDIPVFEDERGKNSRPRVLAWLTTEQYAARQSKAHATAKSRSSARSGQRSAKVYSAHPGKVSSAKLLPTGISAIGGQFAAPVAQAVTHLQPLQSILRPAVGQTDALAVFAKIAAMEIVNDEDEERRRAGGGGGVDRLFASTRSFRSANATQAVVARAAIAAGAQPAVFKVISSASSRASAGALLQYLGTREGEDGKKHDIEIFTHTGETLTDREERRALLEGWKEDFREPFQSTNFVEATITMAGNVSRDALHDALNSAFGAKPFVYARSGETVKVFAYTDTKVAGIVRELRAIDDEHGRGGTLQRADAALTEKLAKAGVLAKAEITAAVSTDRQAQYFLQKFIRSNSQLIQSNGDGLKDMQRADRAAAQLFAEWKADFKTIEPRNVYHVLFSARPGTDPKAMLEAARNLLSEQIPDHKWVIAHHPETRHVHVHAMILARSELGGQLRFSKPELYEWRANFAEKAREQGIAMVATNRMDLAATRPFNARQAGAYERSKRETRYSVDTAIAQRVEAKRGGLIEPKTLAANGTAIASGWKASAVALQTAFPGSGAVQSAEGFSATIISMAGRGHDVAKPQRPQERQAPTVPDGEPQTGMFADMMKEMTNMALTPTEYRQKMVNINKSFDEMAETLPDPKAREALDNVRAEFNEFMNERLDEIRAQRAEEVNAAGAATRAHSRSLKEKSGQTKTQDRAHEIVPAKNEKAQEAARTNVDKGKNAEQAKASEDQNRTTQRSRDDDEYER